MQNNIIDLLGFKDRDICARITKTSPSSVEVMVSKACKPKYCPVCSHRMYSRGPYTRTLNHPILQDGRKVTILLKQRRWKCTNSVCGHFETEQFSFVERYKHNTNMTDFMIVEDFRTPTHSLGCRNCTKTQCFRHICNIHICQVCGHGSSAAY